MRFRVSVGTIFIVMPCLTRMRFPGLTSVSTFDALSELIRSPAFTWATCQGQVWRQMAIVNASAATVANRLSVNFDVLPEPLETLCHFFDAGE